MKYLGMVGHVAHFVCLNADIRLSVFLVSQVTGVITQGRGDGSEWVSEYLVSYSPDGESWNYVTDNSDIARVSILLQINILLCLLFITSAKVAQL